jgi:hypothetical protein
MTTCPNCEDGVVSCLRGMWECPDCRGTGEIQEDDWWMCEHRELTISLPLQFDCGEFCYAARYYTIDEIKPLYRMERAK